jgi:hypothetical protein
MSYSRIFHLKKVKLVCELYHRHKAEDVPVAVTFRKHIQPIHPMHLQTFYKFLGTNYELELRQLQKKNKK